MFIAAVLALKANPSKVAEAIKQAEAAGRKFGEDPSDVASFRAGAHQAGDELDETIRRADDLLNE